MFSCSKFVRSRELGLPLNLPLRDSLYSLIYKNVQVSTTTETTPLAGQDWGAVFGFGFSTDGSLLVAACENNCMLMYDPHNAKLITRRFKTHDNCVNCVKFLDNRLFATCSDDSTVRIWDARSVKQELMVLTGHTNWVKNIEYCPSVGKLVTSGFDGNILAWDINNYSEKNQAEELLYINGMMRTKVCPDDTRMIMSTIGGYYILIHDLDLDHLKDDLHGFRPRLFGSVMLNPPVAPSPLLYSDMFSRKRNRVEFISDFPAGDEAESISAMEVHPQGWCIVSRNTTADEQSEWTCVHDIQPFEFHKPAKAVRRKRRKQLIKNIEIQLASAMRQLRQVRSLLHSSLSRSRSQTEGDELSSGSDSESGSSEPDASDMDLSPSVSSRRSKDSWSAMSSPAGMDDADIGTSGHPSSSAHAQRGQSSSHNRNSQSSRGIPFRRRRFSSGASDSPGSSVHGNDANPSLYPPRRLLFHSEEPNVGQGYIKEQSFSSDGRLIASPFGNCVRLLAFDADCHELCDLIPSKPRPLRQVGLTAGNKSSVLCSTFSPTHLMYVAGAEDGSISFCSPRL